MALGLNELIAMKQEIASVETFEVEALGRTLECRLLPAARVMSRLDEADKESMEAMLKFNCWLIYTSCAVLHKQELLDAYGITGDPEELVPVLFRQNAGAIDGVAADILKRYADRGDSVKN